MKIASEIVATIREIEGKHNLTHDGGLDDAGMIEVITAKLKPVRKKIESVRSGSSMLTSKADAVLVELLDLFEEEWRRAYD